MARRVSSQQPLPSLPFFRLAWDSTLRLPRSRRRVLKLQRHLLVAPGPVALLRALGLLGLGATVFGVLTWPLVPSTISAEARGLILGGAALTSGSLVAAPARWLAQAPTGVMVTVAIALATAYTIATGGEASPYRAGFVAIVLLVAFFAELRRAIGVSFLGLAGLSGAFVADGTVALRDVATLASTTALTLMVAVSTAWLATRQRRHARRLARRMAQARAEAAWRRTESFTDQLTGLGNRRHFDHVLAAELDRHPARPLVLVLADIDGLKRVNDEHGHLAGDQMIKAVGDALRGMLRADDRTFRIGGDEFAALLSGPDQAVLTARLARGIGADLPDIGPVRASTGVAAVAEHDTPDTLVARADAALYAAKLQRRSGQSADPRRSTAEPTGAVSERLTETSP